MMEGKRKDDDDEEGKKKIMIMRMIIMMKIISSASSLPSSSSFFLRSFHLARMIKMKNLMKDYLKLNFFLFFIIILVLFSFPSCNKLQ
jgi:hypothetical protein